MSDLRSQAMECVNELESHLTQLREYVRKSRGLVSDPEALVILTQVQTQLMTSGSDVALIRSTLSAAATCGLMRGTRVQPDHAMRAANDHTLDPDPELQLEPTEP